MPSWNDLAQEFEAQAEPLRGPWLMDRLTRSLSMIGHLRGGRTVILYASSFLQKPGLPGPSTMITHEDLHGMMSAVFGVKDCENGLTLVLHTPGGVTNAAESIVAYLRSKFADIEVIVPTLAMSAGTMIALAADRIVMGRQSQLGPIDPQMNMPDGRTVSAQAVVEQFKRARAEVLADQRNAHVWASILPSLGPALLQEAQNALDYSEDMVARWLAEWMLSDDPESTTAGRNAAHHFNDASTHKSHGRRIGRDEARAQQLVVEDLEDSQLQEAVLTLYHLMTLVFEQTPAAKLVWTDAGRSWMKNMAVAMQPSHTPAAP